MIDLHCHILPGIDDGPPDLEGTLALARAQEAAGVRTVAATPHVTWDHRHNDAASIRAAVTRVDAALFDAGIGVRVVPGAEIAVTLAADLDDAELRGLALGGVDGGGWLLVECPLHPAAVGFDAVLHHLSERGHRIVLAHPERSPALQRDPAKVAELVEAGMLTSITAGALVGRFGRVVERFAADLVARGLVHSVASDAHAAEGRGPGLLEDVRAAGLEGYAEWWTDAVPAAILDGGAIPPPPAVEPARRGVLSRLRRER